MTTLRFLKKYPKFKSQDPKEIMKLAKIWWPTDGVQILWIASIGHV